MAFLLTFQSTTNAADYSSIKIDEKICSDNDPTFGLTPCTGTDGFISRIKKQIKQDARNYLYLYKKNGQQLVFDSEMGFCLLHKPGSNQVMSVGKVQEPSQGPSGSFCPESNGCKTEYDWINGLKVGSAKKSYEELITEIESKTIRTPTCAQFSEAITKILNGNGNGKPGLLAVREDIKIKFKDLKEKLNYKELTTQCDGSKEYNLNSTFGHDKVGMTKDDRTASFCHLVKAQQEIEKAFKSLLRCEFTHRTDNENYNDKFMVGSNSVLKLNAVAYRECFTGGSKSSSVNCYKQKITAAFNQAATRNNNTPTADSDLNNVSSLEGWKETPLACGSDWRSSPLNTTQTNSNSLNLFVGLFFIPFRRNKLKNKSSTTLKILLILGLFLSLNPKFAHSGGANNGLWGASKLDDYGTLNSSVKCRDGTTLDSGGFCEAQHYTPSHGYAYWRVKFNNCLDWWPYDACKHRKRYALDDYAAYVECIGHKVEELNQQCDALGHNNIENQGNPPIVTDISNDANNSIAAAAELTGNQNGEITLDEKPNGMDVGVKTSKASDGLMTKSKESGKSNSGQNDFKGVGSNLKLGNPGSGIQAGNSSSGLKSMFGQGNDPSKDKKTADSKNTSQSDSAEFSSANKNAQGSLMPTSSFNSAELDANSMGGADALELGARAPGSLSEEGLDDYLNRVGSLSLFERIHPHNIKHGKAVMLDNVRAQFEKMRR